MKRQGVNHQAAGSSTTAEQVSQSQGRVSQDVSQEDPAKRQLASTGRTSRSTTEAVKHSQKSASMPASGESKNSTIAEHVSQSKD